MQSPGTGNDCPEVGKVYIFRLFETDDVFTAEGDELRIRTFNGSESQLWKCVAHSLAGRAFTNYGTGKYLGRGSDNRLVCSATYRSWSEWTMLIPCLDGGFQLYVTAGILRFRPISLKTDSCGLYATIGDTIVSDAAIGLHLCDTLPPPLIIGDSPPSRSSLIPDDGSSHREPSTTQVRPNIDDSMSEGFVRNRSNNMTDVSLPLLSDDELQGIVVHNIPYTYLHIPGFPGNGLVHRRSGHEQPRDGIFLHLNFDQTLTFIDRGAHRNNPQSQSRRRSQDLSFCMALGTACGLFCCVLPLAMRTAFRLIRLTLPRYLFNVLFCYLCLRFYISYIGVLKNALSSAS